MNTVQTAEPSSRRPLRLWPGVVAAFVVLLLRLVVLVVVPDSAVYGLIGGVAGGAVILLWWLFFSRARWSERIGAVVLTIVATLATKLFVHPSIAGGLMGNMLNIYAVPITLGPAFVAWAVATRHSSDRVRWVTMAATIALACGVWTLARTDGIKGSAGAQLAWRWSPTPEQRLLEQARNEPEPVAPAPEAAEVPAVAPAEKPAHQRAGSATRGSNDPAGDVKAATSAPTNTDKGTVTTAAPGERTGRRAEWPGFRGPERDSIIRGVRINTDWAASPPVEMWRRPIGPGWSSFAVRGDVLYTQEQRGDNEVVAAYRVSSGQPVWRHTDPVRFYESNGGAGPRGTPTIDGDRVYALGATGILNALDAATGKVLWTRNTSSDTGVKIPGWGFTSSPLVVDNNVIVAVSGALAAYDRSTGDRRWLKPSRGGSYSSPHLVTMDGVTQVLMLGGSGVTSVAPADGTVLWENEWKGVSIIQPALTADGDVLFASGDAMGGLGMRRVSVAHGPNGWTAAERWTTRGLKPYFNDFVIHDGHAFGFDGSILACIDLNDGARKWKGGRYGNGQLVLLPEQDLLLVLSEDGELALVRATSDEFKELGRFKAIEGKTWNHPALVGNVLLVRNGEEMAAFKLALEGR
jgi:outer membrane protein assembly factor BamB